MLSYRNHCASSRPKKPIRTFWSPHQKKQLMKKVNWVENAWEQFYTNKFGSFQVSSASLDKKVRTYISIYCLDNFFLALVNKLIFFLLYIFRKMSGASKSCKRMLNSMSSWNMNEHWTYYQECLEFIKPVVSLLFDYRMKHELVNIE
jgi:hypothetical protein